jgi:FlaA1/EpsC-like NDP-sugar epimerase
MLKEREAVIGKAMILFDAFTVSLAFFGAYFLRQHFHLFYKLDLVPSTKVIADFSAPLSDHLVVFFFILPIWCAVLYLNGMYRSLRTRKLLQVVWIIIKSSLFVTLVFGAFVFLFKFEFVSRLFFIIFIGVNFVLTLSEKIVVFSYMHYVHKRGHNHRRLLVVGTGKRTSHFIKRIQEHPEWGLRILGAIDDEPGRGIESVNGIKVIGTLSNIPEILQGNAIDEVIFVVPRSRLSHMENAIYECETRGVKATIAVDLFDMKIAKAYLEQLDGIPLVAFKTTVAKEWQLFFKRMIDIVISGLSIVLLSPLLLIIAVLIKLTSSGPVLFKQERFGLNGRKFILCKFRTMYKGAQEKLSNIEDVNNANREDFEKIQH